MVKKVKIPDLNIIVSREPMRRRTNLSTLPPAQKQEAWRKLKISRPEVAELLKSESVAAIIKTFNASVLVSPLE